MLDSLWSRFLVALEPRVPATAFQSWVRPCRLATADGPDLRVVVPSEFARERLARHLDALCAAAREVLGEEARVTLELAGAHLSAIRTPGIGAWEAAAAPGDDAPGSPAARNGTHGHPGSTPSALAHAPRADGAGTSGRDAAAAPGNGAGRGAPGIGPSPAATLEPRPPGGGLASRYTFAAFVVGDSNHLAHAACQAVAECPSRSYNPLFVYGGSGLGKTHLLRAIGHEIARRHPSLRLAYLSSERFTNELITAIRHDRTADFRAKYRTIDVLLVDDIQFVSGKERTQGEFAHTFNDLYEARSQIVVSSDCAPKKIPEIEDQLRSRLEGGLIADIRSPDFETRLNIVRRRAELERVDLPDDVAELIARRAQSNVREIEGSMTRLIAFCSLRRREMTVEVAHEVLDEFWGREERDVTIEGVQRKVAECFGVSIADLRGASRARTVVHARQVAMYLARQLTHASLAEVGRAFGGKDHTTVLHAVDKIHTQLQRQPTLLDRLKF